jgi:hypothetical protein
LERSIFSLTGTDLSARVKWIDPSQEWDMDIYLAAIGNGYTLHRIARREWDMDGSLRLDIDNSLRRLVIASIVVGIFCMTVSFGPAMFFSGSSASTIPATALDTPEGRPGISAPRANIVAASGQ